MGYRSDIRIVTSKEGFEKLKEFVKNYLKEQNEEYNLFERFEIKEIGKDQVYFGWNSLKWYEGYPEVDAVMNGLDYLEENDYSYRYAVLGESYDDYEEQYYDADRESEPCLEFPCLIREFDDNYILNLIGAKKLENLEENKEQIEYE